MGARAGALRPVRRSLSREPIIHCGGKGASGMALNDWNFLNELKAVEADAVGDDQSRKKGNENA